MNRTLVLVIWGVIGAAFVAVMLNDARLQAREQRIASLLDAVDTALAHADRQQQTAALAGIAAAKRGSRPGVRTRPRASRWPRPATSEELEARSVAADAWARAGYAVSDAMIEGERVLERGTLDELRRLHNRTRIGMGDLAGAADDLERMIEEQDGAGATDPEFRTRVREDLAETYYHAARLMRLRGDPERAWQLVSERARQHARVLAEDNDPLAGGLGATTRHQRNLEVIMEFERTPLELLDAEPLPQECPGGNCKNLNLDTWPWKRQRNSEQPEDGRSRVGGGSGGGS